MALQAIMKVTFSDVASDCETLPPPRPCACFPFLLHHPHATFLFPWRVPVLMLASYPLASFVHSCVCVCVSVVGI